MGRSAPAKPMIPTLEVHRVEVDDPVARALLEGYFAELRRRFGEYEPPTEEQLRDDAISGVILVAYDAGHPAGCASLRLIDNETAEVKRMFVAPEARGRGVGRALLLSLEEEARVRQCRRVVLDTAASLVEAARMYVREGYRAIERYNDNPYAARWFEKKLT
jgi:GNAT superfamily N-acetyltransferase